MPLDYTTLSDEELADVLYGASEHLGEIQCQAGSETSLYGDAWPGAMLDIEAAANSLKAVKAEADRRWGKPQNSINQLAGDLDIPF